MTKLPSGSNRQGWIDVARGIGVILVVFGHVLGGLVGAGIVPHGPAALWANYALYTFHMPLFFFLAGLNVPHSLARGTGPFLRAKLWTLAYPYVLWSLIQGGVIMLASRHVNTPIAAADLLAIPYRPIAQFWFLYALLLCHVLAAMARRLALLAGLATAGFVVFQLLPVRPDLALTLHDLPLYVAGIWLARTATAWTPPGGARWGWTGAAAVACAFALAVLLAGPQSGFDEQALAAAPACVLGVLGVVWASKLVARGWLAAVGRMSMTIYVLHILAAAGMRIVLLRLSISPQPAVYLLAGTAAGVLAPMLVHVVLSRAGVLPLLGLASPRTQRSAEHSLAIGRTRS